MKDPFWWKKLSELERRLYRELYKKSFYEFAKEFWDTADPKPLVDGKIVQFFCEIFQYMARGWIRYEPVEPTQKVPSPSDKINVIDVRQDKNKLNLNLPPSHSKSMILNVLAGAWIITNAPIKLASVSHTQDLAGEMNKKRQFVLNSEKFKFFFPEIQLVTNTTFSLKDNRGAELYSINRNAMTGYHSDIIVNDDLTNARAAVKDKMEMENAWNYYRDTMPSRISDMNNYCILNIQQRLSANDITSHILEDAKLSSQYIFVVLPARFETETYIVCPISGTVFHYLPEDPLWPERFGDYSSIEISVGDQVWETQYMQKPRLSSDAIVKEEMLNIKSINEVPNIMQADTIYASHDFPVKANEESDFLGSVIGYKIEGMLYIKFATEEKKDYINQIEFVKSIDTLYPGIIQIIEDKANGSPLLNQLQEVVPGMQPYQPGTQDKPQRMKSATLYMKNVIFIADEWDERSQKYVLNPGMLNLFKNLQKFPFLKHDDVCDAFSQLVNFVFMDKRFQVYGRSFNKLNIYEKSKVQEPSYSFIFFNKEGDNWKALDIGIEYAEITKLYVKKEFYFKATIEDGIKKLKEFAPDKTVFIDASTSEALYGMFQEGVSIERYEVQDFDKSVSDLTLAFSSRKVMVENECKLLRGDIDNFKFEKSKDDNAVKYRTQKDGFIACIRIAMHFYGGIV